MNKLFFIPIGLLLATGLFLFLLLPKISMVNYLAEEVGQKQEEFQQRQGNLIFTLSTLNELKHYQPALDKLSTALPVDFFPASLLGYFQEQALKSGLVFKGISENQGQALSQKNVNPGEATAAQGTAASAFLVKEYNFFCQTQGSVENFEAFLKLLEKSSRLIEIENFSFTASDLREEAPEFNLQAKVYYY